MANPATEQAPEKPLGSPEHLAKTFSTDATQAHKELQDDLRCMTPAARSDFFRNLKGAANGATLPGLEITEDAQHKLKVNETVDGKKTTLLDETGASKPDVGPVKPDAGPAKPDAPAANPAEQLTSPLKRGEGPYQALHRTHPEWDHKKLMEESKRILAQTGRKEFKQGESFKANPDGSVTSHEQTSKDGSFKETTSAGGKVVGTKVGDGQGNWKSTTADGSTEHKVTPDGYTETKTNGDGKPVSKVVVDKNGERTETYDKDGQIDSNNLRRPDGSTAGWKQNADGSRTFTESPDKDHSTETTTKDGKTISTKTTEPTDTGSKVVTTDEKGTQTDLFGKDGKPVSGSRENTDGSSSSWKQNDDGTVTKVDQPDKLHRTETVTKDDKVVSTKTHEELPNGSYKDVVKDGDGKVQSTRTHEITPNGFKEVETGPDGKVISTKTHETTPKGTKDVETDASGKPVKSVETEKQQYGSKTTITDQQGQIQNGYDLKGNQVSGVKTNNDGSSTGWTKTPDGHVTHFNVAANGNRSETTFDEKGNIIGNSEYDKAKDTTVAHKYENGKIITTTTTPGILNSLFGHNESTTVVDGLAPKGPEV